MRKDTTCTDNREVSCQSMAEITSDEIECVGDKRNRKSYCLAFKLEAIKYAEENGTCKAEKLYKIRESTIRGWRKQKQDIQALCQLKETGKFQLNRTSLRTAQWPELEEKLLVYVLKQKSEGKMLRQTSVLKIAVKLAKQSGIADFKASPGWLQRFKQRHGLYDT